MEYYPTSSRDMANVIYLYLVVPCWLDTIRPRLLGSEHIALLRNNIVSVCDALGYAKAGNIYLRSLIPNNFLPYSLLA